MSRPFALPDLGEGLTEAEIVKVLVNEGDVLAEDAPLLEVETDKATVEIPSPFAGRVARVHVQPGQTVKVGDVLVTFDDAGAQAASGKGGGGAGDRLAGFGTPLAREPVPRSPAPLPRRESELRPVGVSQTSTGSAASPSTRGDGPVPATQARAPADASKGSVAAAATASGVRVGPVPATPATRRLAR